MAIDKKFIDLFVKTTSKAALASSYLVGKKDKILADKAAVDSMRFNLNNLELQGQIVIGEGELDEAPMLHIGEKVGSYNGEEIDIAVDPIEGTNFVAKNLPGGISVLAAAPKNGLFNSPETYMHKLAFSGQIEKDALDLDFTNEKNFKNLADSLNKNIEDLNICLLDRPRHNDIIETAKKFKINIKLISDGDVAGALLVTNKIFNIDLFLGIGGGPEGNTYMVRGFAKDGQTMGAIFDKGYSGSAPWGQAFANMQSLVDSFERDSIEQCEILLENG